MRAASATWFLLPLFGVLAGACGGGASEEEAGESPRPILLRIHATPALDGTVLSDGTYDTTGAILFVGDRDAVANGVGARQFFSFELDAVPADATILTATACFHSVDRIGAPYGTHGRTMFQVVDYGPSLDPADFDVPTLEEIVGLIADNPADPTVGMCVNVTNRVVSCRATSVPRVQLRIRWEHVDSDSDGVSDHTIWVDGEMTPAGSIQPPTLEVYYQPAG